jgi:hypothetical protein
VLVAYSEPQTHQSMRSEANGVVVEEQEAHRARSALTGPATNERDILDNVLDPIDVDPVDDRIHTNSAEVPRMVLNAVAVEVEHTHY